jgi:hypothetical protein
MSTQRLKTLRVTCSACPTQWEGTTEDGKHFYARYRWGRLTWGFGSGIDAAVDAAMDTEGKKLGGDLDGELSTRDMLENVGLVFA